ncbi:UDP-2,3-diacylglucosamine diphosphatase [Massilia sp. W12]|uniref:UDP-2,3-diacylglucosamine diphosphatase n=1 Tax=Massilia sp. W12 TaxID=3126507 RepID=UPI0030D1BAF1
MTPGFSSAQRHGEQPLALFVSDVHLDPAAAKGSAADATRSAFLRFLQHANQAPALYLLGDIFEYWAGDDDLDAPEHADWLAALQSLHEQGVQLYWIAGNRDFLAGAAFAKRCGITLLAENHVLQCGPANILLCHGDAACTDDHEYMAFRAQARTPAWQQAFLARPLAQRKAMIAQMRAHSMQRQAGMGAQAMLLDVNQDSIAALLDAYDCRILLHGHTHRPQCHRWQRDGLNYERHVLPDWDVGAGRGGYIRLEADGSLSHWRLQQD